MSEDSLYKPESRADTRHRAYPVNPIGVVALFVFFIEVVATISLKLLLDVKSFYAGYIVFFIIAFPSVLSLLFFGTLWFRRESLYSPTDFREDANFLKLIAKVDERFESVEIRQKAATLDMAGDPDEVFSLVPELLGKGEIEVVIILGRGFLKVRRYSRALQVFDRLADVHIPENLQLKVIAFKAYSLNGLGKHEKALKELEKLRLLSPAESERFWPALAFSYSHLKLGHQEKFELWLVKAKSASAAFEDMNLALNIYPDLKVHLAGQSLPERS